MLTSFVLYGTCTRDARQTRQAGLAFNQLSLSSKLKKRFFQAVGMKCSQLEKIVNRVKMYR
jgi:hypothetical protein